jgi:anti-anti-sigma factor
MEVTVSKEQGRVPVMVFHIKGDIATDGGEQLQKLAREAFEGGARHLLLDLRHVPFISSWGLRALHTIYMLMRTGAPDEKDEVVQAGLQDGSYKSHHLKLLNPSRDVTRVLSLAGYDMFLEIHQDLNEAVASF